MSTLIEFDEVCKYYQMGDTLVKAADHVSFKINKGEFVAIVGQSGSGKSTCMNIIGCADVPTEGAYLLDGRDVGKMSRRELASIRNEAGLHLPAVQPAAEADAFGECGSSPCVCGHPRRTAPRDGKGCP